MKLHEYQSKLIFAKYGVPIPRGRVASTADEARHIAEELGGHVVIKSQVLVGGRGKAGGIRLAKTPKEAADLATTLLAMDIKGLPVRKVLVDEAVGINKEIYLGITNDRAARRPVMMASSAGGVDIEEVAATAPEKIIKTRIDPFVSRMSYIRLPGAMGLRGISWKLPVRQSRRRSRHSLSSAGFPRTDAPPPAQRVGRSGR